MSSEKQCLEEFREAHTEIEYIRLQWIDYSGVLRARFVPIDRCVRIADGSEDVCLAQNSMLIPISHAPRSFSQSDYHETWCLWPDWTSLQRCGFKPNHASVMSFVDQKDAQQRFDKCPRTLLTRAVQQLEEQWHASALVGFEIEFVLMDASDHLYQPLDRLDGYSRTAGLRGETLNLVEDIIKALSLASIRVHHFHAEAFDQLEIALAPDTPLKAVDSLILAQETIRTVCLRRNLKASMAPKPMLHGPLNGLHLHLSVDGLDQKVEDNFLAGIMTHLSSLCAFGMPTYDSYSRSVSDAAGAWIGFGTDNRDLPVRKIRDKHWEIRILDGAANPYLFVAVTLLAALDGLKKETELTFRDCNIFPHLMDDERRGGYDILERMPASLKEALERLKEDGAVRGWMPEELLIWYISVKEKEVEGFEKMTDEERRLRVLQYF